MEETTVSIGGLEYTITEYGDIYKRRGSGFLKCFPDKDGYPKVSLTLNKSTRYNEALHRVVYRAWHGQIPDGMTVDHIDNDRTNNHRDNLQLMSAKDNTVKGNAKHWVITSPEGVEYHVYNLAKFCRDYNLHRGHLCDRKRRQYKGWKCYET